MLNIFQPNVKIQNQRKNPYVNTTCASALKRPEINDLTGKRLKTKKGLSQTGQPFFYQKAIK